MNNLKIFACFTRSFDDNHLNKNKINLISSIVATSLDYDLDNSQFYNDKRDYIIIRVVDESYFFDRDYRIEIKEPKQNLKLIIITLEELLSNIMFDRTNNKNYLLNQIFGMFQINNKYDKFDNRLYRNTLFEFNNGLNWSNIVLNFKFSGINIGGGSISRRHVLNSVNYDLITFLNILYKDYYIISDILYKNFNTYQNLLTNKIDIKIYEKFEMAINKIYNLSIKNMITTQNKFTLIKEAVNNILNYNINLNLDNEFKNLFYKISNNIIENGLKVYEFLENKLKDKLKIILDNTNKNIENLNIKIRETRSNVKIKPYNFESVQKKSYSEKVQIRKYEEYLKNEKDLKINLEHKKKLELDLLFLNDRENLTLKWLIEKYLEIENKLDSVNNPENYIFKRYKSSSPKNIRRYSTSAKSNYFNTNKFYNETIVNDYINKNYKILFWN